MGQSVRDGISVRDYKFKLGAILYAVVRVEMIAQMSRDSDSLSASSNLPRDSR